MKPQTEQWIEIADLDLEAANRLVEAMLPFQGLFFCQQAVEKLMKGLWIERKTSLPPRTHNLVQLATELDLSVPAELDDLLVRLTDLAVESRYPGKADQTPEMARIYLQRTTELYQWLRQLLS
ncbi:MAG: HEPN domain-containing protein [Dehalococcoidia bacterium]